MILQILKFTEPNLNNRIYKLENFAYCPIELPLKASSNREARTIGKAINITYTEKGMYADIRVDENISDGAYINFSCYGELTQKMNEYCIPKNIEPTCVYTDVDSAFKNISNVWHTEE